MAHKLDFDVLCRDILAVLRRHDLRPESFGISVTLTQQDFNVLAAHRPESTEATLILRNCQTEGIQASVQIMKQREFPPEMHRLPPK